MDVIHLTIIRPDESFPEGFEIINPDHEALSLPIPGFDDSTYEALINRTPYNPPPYDERLFKLNVHEGPSEQGVFDEEFPEYRMWLTTYSLTPESTEQKERAIDEVEQTHNSEHIPTSKILKMLATAWAITDRRSQGLTVTEEMNAFTDSLHPKCLKIWQNHLLGMQKKADLQAGNQIDIDAGWE